MASFIGIDLGTTYSLVSYLDDTGRPQIIRNAEGQNLTPSCIEINGDEVTVGEIARKGLGWNDKVLARFKRDMGTSEKYKVGDKEFTPTECSVFILKKLLADAIQYVCHALQVYYKSDSQSDPAPISLDLFSYSSTTVLEYSSTRVRKL